MITIGRLVGLQDQINLKKQPTRAIFVHLTAWLFTGTFGMLITTIFPNSGVCFWLGLSLYGLGNGPCVGYCYDLVNRRAAQESEIPNFKGSYLGRVPLVSADFWTSDHLSERPRSVDAFFFSERARAAHSR